jgi:outer membrane protein OmpA-like peptidoglycan-associated protein
MKSEKLITSFIITIFLITLASFLFEKYKDKRIGTLERIISTQSDEISKMNKAIQEKQNMIPKEEFDALSNENKALALKISTLKNGVQEQEAAEEERQNARFEKLANDLKAPEVRGNRVLLEVVFDSNESQISSIYEGDLKNSSKTLLAADYSNWVIQIEGFAQDGENTNKKSSFLALERAYHLGLYLVSLGISSDKIVIKGAIGDSKKCTEILLKRL